MELSQCATVIFQAPNESIVYDTLKIVSAVYKPIHTYLSIIICVLGAGCNFCNIVVLTRKTMRTPVNMILLAMAFCDTVVLFSNLIFTTHFTFVSFTDCYPGHWSKGWAMFLIAHAHLSLIGHSSSVWLSVMLALIRYVTLRSRGNASSTQIVLKHSYIAIGLVISGVTFINIPNFLTYKIVEELLSSNCQITDDRYLEALAYVPGVSDLALDSYCLVFRLAFWISGVVFKLIPCILLTILVWLLTRILNEVQKNRMKLFKGSSKYSPPSTEINAKTENNYLLAGPKAVANNNGSHYSLIEKNSSPSSRSGVSASRKSVSQTAKGGKTDRTTRMLLSIVALVLITEAPQGMMAVCSGLFSEEFRLHIYNNLGDILDLMSLLSSCSTFLVYCCMSGQFRNEFKRVFFKYRFKICGLTCAKDPNGRRPSEPYSTAFKSFLTSNKEGPDQSENYESSINVHFQIPPSIVIANDDPTLSMHEMTSKSVTPVQYDGNSVIHSPRFFDDTNSKCSQSLLLTNSDTEANNGGTTTSIAKLKNITTDEIVETITPNNVQSNNLNFEGKAINYPSTISIVGRKQKAVVFMKLLVNKNGINESRVVIHDVDTLSSLAMAVDAASNKAFCNENWVKESGEKIKVINLESNKVEKKLDLIEHIGEEMVTSLAFDWIGKNLFVAIDTDPIQNTGRIYVCRVDVPSKCGVVISKGLTNLESIAVDPIDGYLYWINKHGKRIERSFMNGMHHDKHPFQENLEKDNVYRLTSLTLDLVNKKLYYVAINSISSEIFVCDFYQRNSCKPIIANIQTSHIDHYDNKIYWTSTNTNSGSIYYCKKNFCENTSKMIANSSNIEDFALVAVQNQPPRTDPNPCAINNGDCSDICILHPGEPFYSCQCPVGIKLKSNGKTCNPDGIEEVLFIASATNLLYISLDTPELIPRPLHKNDSNTFLKIQDLDYDSRRQWIYWLDGIEYKVMRGKWNDTLIETVHSFDKKEAIEAFKVDYIGQNLIWIDSENGKIEMMSMESKSRKIVYFSKFLKNTNSFAYDIVSGIIMFTEKKHGAFIFKSIKVDGSDETTLLQLPIGSSPMGIEIDSKLNKFYWAESGSNSILSADLQTGTNVEILSSGLRNPFSISKLGERLYFNSINDRTLSYINLQDYDEVGDKTAEEYSNFDNPNVVLISDAVINGNQKGLKVSNVVSKMPTSRFDLCVNKQCTHICTTVNDGIAKCLCKNGQVLSEDGVTCQSINASLIYSRFSIDDDLMRSSVSPQFNLNERMFLGGISDSIQYIYPFRDSLLIAGTGRSPNHFHQQIGYIKKINLTNHQTTTLLISTSSPLIDGISVDDVTGNIFFANRYLKRIEIINEKGSVRRTLLWKNIDPSLVVVEKSQNMLYFVNDSISILRTPIYLNYQHLTTVIKCEDPITSFAIDHHSKLLIYATMNIHDLTKGTIYSTNLDGTNKKQLLSIPKLHALHITPHHLSLLFFNKHNGSVMAFENNELHHHSQIDDLISLTILTTTNAHPSSSLIKAACSAKPSSKAFCNHICLAKNLVESECVCQDHFIYDKEKKICVIKESFVMVSESNKLVRFQIDKVSGGADTLENEPPFYFDLPNIGEINSLSFDPMSVKKYFYWIDSADPSNVVRSSMLPDEPSMTMDEIKEYSKCKSFHYLTIDNSGRQLFVSCSLTLALNMSSIHAFRITAHDDFIYVGVIVSESRYSPRQIEVFNKLNALFFINAISDTSSRIIRCRFDGRDCKALSYTSTDDLSWHSLSLASDTFSQRLLYSSPSSIYSKDVHVDLDLRQRLNLNDILHNSQAFAMSTIAFSHNSLAIAINSRAKSGLFLLKYNTSSHANTFNDLVSLAYYGPSRGSNVKILGGLNEKQKYSVIYSLLINTLLPNLVFI
uniref:G_PROTEIN_RECEP_F1_2 domain-containing protein n=1 Tax=Rhabditophanes sp. KR3021 TaxID=114890 RepID=A0AC35TJC4_9BILA